MIRGPRPLALVGALVVMALPSCAWSNEDNRPVWNAFEANLVPNGGGVVVAGGRMAINQAASAVLILSLSSHEILFSVVESALLSTVVHRYARGRKWLIQISKRLVL